MAYVGDGRVVAALNVNCHAAETTVTRLVDHHLPLLLQTAGEISADFSRVRSASHASAVHSTAPTEPGQNVGPSWQSRAHAN